MSREFKLSDDDVRKVETWAAEQDAKWVASGKLPDPLGSDEPYYGAIGGALTYEFTPTSIGVVIQVRHANDEVLDLSDYEHW